MRYVVLHYTGMGAEEWLTAVCDPKTELSAHYLIGLDGAITQLVEETKRAWHAGESFWRGITDMNSASIGVELVNPGHERGYKPFPSLQISALKKLLNDMVRRYGLNSADFLLGHSDIAPTRKKDPGELFPWQELALDGLGLWAGPLPGDYKYFDDCSLQELLGDIGYDARDLEAVLAAFQRRYVPDNVTGTPDIETVARIRAIGKLIG